MRKLYSLLLVFVFLAGVQPLFADTITLKSGQEIEGKIIERGDNVVKVDFMGVEMTYFLDDIAKINGEDIVVGAPGAGTGVAVVIPQIPSESIGVAAAVVSDAVILSGGEQSGSTSEVTVVESQPASQPAEEVVISEEVTMPAQSSANSPRSDTSAGYRQRESNAPELSPQAKKVTAATAIGVALVVILLSLLIYAYSAICLYFIAKKTNSEPVWLAWVPIGNLFLMCKIAGLSYWLLLIFLASFIPFIGGLINLGLFGFFWFKIAEARGKPGWMGILCVLPLVNFVMMGIIAFSE